MIHEIKTISLIIAFIFPFVWGITFISVGLKKERSKIFLFLLMLSASFTYMMTFFKFENYIELYAILFPVQAGIVWVLFPLLFLYVKSLTSERQISLIKVLLNFIPFVFFLILYLVLQKAFVDSALEVNFVKHLLDKKVHIDEYFEIGKAIYDVAKICLVVSALVYVVAIAKIMRNHYLKVKETFSENESNELKWLRGLGYLFILMVVFFVSIHVLKNSKVEEYDWLIAVSYLQFGAFFWYLGLNGFRQKEVYNVVEVAQSEEFESESKVSKKEIEDYLLSTQSYKNQNISVFDMCYHFHTNRTYMSEAIRHNFDLNFRGLINRYRIIDACKVIDENLNKGVEFDLENVATSSGFSSYSTFFRVFRTEKGITPSEYIKKLKK